MSESVLARRLGVIGAATAAVAALGALPALADTAPSVVYVGAPSIIALAQTNSGSSCDQPDVDSVQAGVDEVAPGGTVVVCAGTYAESVSISKPLTLQGQDGAVIDASGHGFGIGIGADHVTVSGLTVQNAEVIGSPPTGLPGDGIVTAVFTAGGPVIGNDAQIFDDVTTGNGGAGIDLDSTSGSVARGNRSYANGAVGINVADDFGRPARNNRILNNRTTDNPNGCGIALADHTGAGIENNLVAGNVSDRNGTVGGGAGLLLASPVPGAVLRNNLFVGNEASGNGHSGFQLHAHAPGDQISGNALVGNSFGTNDLKGDAGDPSTTGIYLGDKSPVTFVVISNRISDDSVGIFAAGPVHLVAFGNRFDNVAQPVVTQPTYLG